MKCTLCNTEIPKKVWNQKYCLECCIQNDKERRKMLYEKEKNMHLSLFMIARDFRGKIGSNVFVSARNPKYVVLKTKNGNAIGKVHRFRYNGVEVELFNPLICQN